MLHSTLENNSHTSWVLHVWPHIVYLEMEICIPKNHEPRHIRVLRLESESPAKPLAGWVSLSRWLTLSVHQSLPLKAVMKNT